MPDAQHLRHHVFRIPVGAEISLEQFSVLNRWGVLVFSTRNPAVGWDGAYHGQPAATGTYVYVVDGKDFGGKPVELPGAKGEILEPPVGCPPREGQGDDGCKEHQPDEFAGQGGDHAAYCGA